MRLSKLRPLRAPLATPFAFLAVLTVLATTAPLANDAARAEALTLAAKPIDPERYLGRWYEIARLPNKIQADCVTGMSDWSRQSNGQLAVVQTCHVGTPNGPAKVWRGAGA